MLLFLAKLAEKDMDFFLCELCALAGNNFLCVLRASVVKMNLLEQGMNYGQQ